MERGGTPNAALWDQKAVFEWIKQFGGLFGGDIANINVWGESAGAGSIVHHLTAFGGKKGDAIFKRAVIQSPAFDPQVDRKGQLEDQFKQFAALAGCLGQGLNCLRNQTLKALRSANDNYVKSMPGGKPGFGPAVDGDYVRQEASLELTAGNVAKNVESIINSHVLDEAQLFVPATVNESVIDAVLQHYFASSPTTIAAIKKHYAAIADPKARIKQIYQFSTFSSHNRFITEAYPGKTYNMQYSRGTGIHGSDIPADFYKPGIFDSKAAKKIGSQFQAYLLSHARTGDPNKERDAATVEWPKVRIGPTLAPVLNVTDSGFALIEDPATKKADSEFWRETLAAFTQELGEFLVV